MSNKSLLLHCCCAPCFGYVYELLKTAFDVLPFFYNPNIAPKKEYKKRLIEIEKYCGKLGCKFYCSDYNVRDWVKVVKKYRFSGEKSERCWVCYEFRLRRSFEFAAEKRCDIVATTLSISPHKDAEKINGIGKKLENEFGIEFLEADFKKNDGFRKSIEISNAEGFYRQNYCGCIYSKLERDKNSLWYKKYKSE
ncbi:MAG: epoxyqueuosine reductase QueH [Spirochaetes bacterium]|nr:epoxyqueuosine reductase QueH [Spirochaetota bacterium]